MLAAQPDITVVALGCPKQEILMHRWSKRGAGPVMLGLGAALDFMAGEVRRAPPVVSAAGLEWLHRLMGDPVRLSYRYLIRDVRVVPILVEMLLRPRSSLVYEVCAGDGGIAAEELSDKGTA